MNGGEINDDDFSLSSFGSARQSVKVFVLRGFLETRTLVLLVPPTTTIAPKWAEFRVRCGNNARWDR